MSPRPHAVSRVARPQSIHCALGEVTPPQRAPEAPVWTPPPAPAGPWDPDKQGGPGPALAAGPLSGGRGPYGPAQPCAELGGPPCALGSPVEAGGCPGSGSTARGTSQPLPCTARALPSWPCFPHSAPARAAPGSSTAGAGLLSHPGRLALPWPRCGAPPRPGFLAGRWALGTRWLGGLTQRDSAAPTAPARMAADTTAVRSCLVARFSPGTLSPPARN